MKNFILILIFILGFVGCSHKKPTISNTKIVQKAYLYNSSKQMDLVNTIMQKNQNFIYTSDIQNFDQDDYWNPSLFNELEKKVGGYIYGDCEDTMLLLSIGLIKNGFPVDQIWYNFFMVPPSELSGITSNWGGHAVLIAEVEGFKPFTLEQLEKPRYLINILTEEAYFWVATSRADESLLGGFSYVAPESWKYFNEGLYQVAITTPQYFELLGYANRIYYRKDYEK